MTFASTSLRRYVRSASDGPFGSALKSEHYVDDGARVIRLGNVGTAEWRDLDEAFIAFDYWSQLRRHHAATGDLIVAGLGDEGHPVGRACVLPEVGPALVKADCFRLSLHHEEADARFLAWYLSSSSGLAASEMLAEGSTRQRLTLGKALGMKVPLLPVARQRVIADYLDAETARIDALLAKKRRMIEVLDERFHANVSKRLHAYEPVPLKRLVSYTEGPGIMAEDFRDEGIPLLRISGLTGATATLNGCNFLDPAMVGRRWSHFAVRRGDYLISASASMGTVCIVDGVADGAIPYTGIIRFRSASDKINMEFVRYFLGSREFMDQTNS
jgi:type I restriction enzyme S subunit